MITVLTHYCHGKKHINSKAKADPLYSIHSRGHHTNKSILKIFKAVVSSFMVTLFPTILCVCK